MDLREGNDKIFSVDEHSFSAVALELFEYQYQNNKIYHQYVDALGIKPSSINAIEKIPFLPIRFFKTDAVRSGNFPPQLSFESSGTTGSVNSRHELKDAGIYQDSFIRGFQLNYGPINEWRIIGLLPSYLERKNSSLVYMVNELIQLTGRPESGFYLDEHDRLATVLSNLERDKAKTLLIGVTFGLLDFAGAHPISLSQTIVMETGGMKGRRKEMVRTEVHELLKQAFGVTTIHSEYGMTELLSQAYSKGNGIFNTPAWMRILLRDEEDPLSIKAFANQPQISGAINIIDLANIHSCSFIATDDVGRLYQDGSFEVMGRMDESDVRGCGLMVV